MKNFFNYYQTKGSSYVFLVVLVLLYVGNAILQSFWGEKIPINNGCGWDGAYYSEAVKNLPEVWETKSIHQNRVQRLIQSALVRGSLNMLHLDYSDKHIIYSFSILNLLLIGLSIYLFFSLADHWQFHPSVSAIGFIGVFGNFALAKNVFYYPVLTDMMGFALGFVCFWSYVKKKQYVLWPSLLIASFSWPVMKMLIPVLLVLNVSKSFNQKYSVKISGNVSKIIAVLLPIIFILIAITTVLFKPDIVAQFGLKTSITGLLFSGLIYSIITYLTYYFLLKDCSLSITEVSFVGIVLVLAWYILSASIIKQFPEQSDFNAEIYLGVVSTVGLKYPIYPIISAFSFFGPIVIIFCRFWKSILFEIKQLGVPLIIFFGLGFLQWIDPETRHQIHLFPTLSMISLLVINKSVHTWNTKLFLAFFTLACVFISDVLCRINTTDFGAYIHGVHNMESASHYATQRYFKHIGCFMSASYYTYYLAFFVAFNGTFLLFFRKSIRSSFPSNNA